MIHLGPCSLRFGSWSGLDIGCAHITNVNHEREISPSVSVGMSRKTTKDEIISLQVFLLTFHPVLQTY